MVYMYSVVRSDIVLNCFFKLVFVVVHSVWGEFMVRDNNKSQEFRELSHSLSLTHLLAYMLYSFEHRFDIVVISSFPCKFLYVEVCLQLVQNFCIIIRIITYSCEDSGQFHM